MKGTITDPLTIQEYEFFVQGDAGETKAAPLEVQNAKGIKGKNGEQDKSRIFFSSMDETEA
jgi:hypothetical protein